MSRELKKANFIPLGIVSACFFAASMLCAINSLAVAAAFLLFCTVVVWLGDGFDESEVRKSLQSHRRTNRRALAEKKSAQSVQAQLNKPDFETRLKSFVDAEQNEGTPDQFVSQMKFWQRNVSYQRSPTRPIGLLRHLLQRIAKLVGRS